MSIFHIDNMDVAQSSLCITIVVWTDYKKKVIKAVSGTRQASFFP